MYNSEAASSNDSKIRAGDVGDDLHCDIPTTPQSMMDDAHDNKNNYNSAIQDHHV